MESIKLFFNFFNPTICLFDFILFPLHISDLNYVEEIKGYTISQRNRAVMVDQRNYTYQKNNKKGNRIFWVCSEKGHKGLKKGCMARASTSGNYIMKLGGTHNHEVNPNVVDSMLLNSENDPLRKE